MGTLLQDLTYGIRLLGRSWGVSAVAVLTLALGIGATGAVFSAVNAVLLRPLPFADSERLVMLWERNAALQLGFDDLPVSPANLVHWQEQSRALTDISGFRGVPLNLTGVDQPMRLGGVRVSASLFRLLGVQAAQGRTFSPEEAQPGADRVVVVSHGLWQTRFGGDPALVGKTITLDDKSFTVVGIMPKGFRFPRAADLPAYLGLPQRTDIWLPLSFTPEQRNDRGTHNLAVMARLATGTSGAQAQAEMDTIARRLEEQFPESSGWGVGVVPLHTQVTRNVRPALLVLLGVVGVVLAVVCVNLANLQLSRALARQKEIAIRMALGAGRLRIVRQLLTESLLLAVLGGAAGLGLAFLGVEGFSRLGPAELPGIEHIDMDGRVLGVVALITLASGVIFGLAPLVLVLEPGLGQTLKGGPGSVGAASGKPGRLRGLLVIVQVALALVLSVGAGMALQRFTNLLQADPGFEPERVLTAQVSLPPARYPERHTVVAFFERVREKLGTLPGVEEAGVSSLLPLGGAEEIALFTIEGRQPAKLTDAPQADNRSVSEGYFEAMGIPLEKGRTFTGGDDAAAPPVVIVNQELVRRFFPGEDPIGKRLKLGDPSAEGPWLSIVGMVGDVRNTGLDAEPRPQVYFPYRQRPSRQMSMVLRTSTAPERLASALRDAVWSVDRDQPVVRIQTMDEYVDASLARRRFSTLLVSTFAALAVLLAAVGLYGVMAYAAVQRTREIGIRMALGAKPKDILGLLMGYGMRVTLVGLAVGLAIALVATRLLSGLLFEVGAIDPLALAGAALLVAAGAMAASYVPSKRATRAQPMAVLRGE